MYLKEIPWFYSYQSIIWKHVFIQIFIERLLSCQRLSWTQIYSVSKSGPQGVWSQLQWSGGRVYKSTENYNEVP